MPSVQPFIKRFFMGIIKKDKPPDNLDTIIGSKTIFEGVLLSNESVCIEGTVKGKVECKGNIVVGKGGKVKADIIAENAFIGGQVNGNIKVKKKLEITSSGKVKGDIETASLIIGEGVVFEGSCHMTGAKSAVNTATAESQNAPTHTAKVEKVPVSPQVGEASS
jgi:cytoskeletal protein CcmA (bactofilin family)